MLTQLEKRALIWFYSVICKYFTPFLWKNGKILLQPPNTGTQLRNCIIWTLLLATLIFRLKQLSIIAQEKNFNQLVFQGTAFIGFLEVGVFKLNIEMHKSEMVLLINQAFHFNSSWGKQFF